MKKLILFSILSISVCFTFCGGKDMDETPDNSNCGPNYYNEFDAHHPKKAEAADSTKN